ncbi:hypothetical protein ACFSHR_02575 [Azotobacter chroococcum]
MHLGPDNALRAWAQLGSGRFLPVHWGTFNLAMHPWSQPADVLLAHASEGLVMPRLGEPVEPARVDAVEPWWRGEAKADWQGAMPQEAESLVLPVKD